jgi:hypothetical protein
MNVATAPNEMMGTKERDVASLVYTLIHGTEGDYGPNIAIAFLNSDGRFETGAVFNNWYPDYGQIEINMASVRYNSLTPYRVACLIDAVIKIGARIVVARCDAGNERVIRLLCGHGGVKYILKDLRGPGKDEAFITLKTEDLIKTKVWRKFNG